MIGQYRSSKSRILVRNENFCKISSSCPKTAFFYKTSCSIWTGFWNFRNKMFWNIFNFLKYFPENFLPKELVWMNKQLMLNAFFIPFYCVCCALLLRTKNSFPVQHHLPSSDFIFLVWDSRIKITFTVTEN